VRRRAPRPLSIALEGLTARLAPATLLADVQRVWEQAAGAAIAREAMPVAERDGTVTLHCASATWMQEVELMGPVLVDQLNEHLGGDRVTGLRVTMAGRRGQAREGR
jgi:predicted nucleic acid-binding Zn ribbon protein